MRWIPALLSLFLIAGCANHKRTSVELDLGVGEYHRYQERAAPPEYELRSEAYDQILEPGFASPLDAPTSTFSVDVDTASYANVRRILNEGRLPPPDAVRVEELLNSFDYSDPLPASWEVLGLATEVMQSPWRSDHQLVRIALNTRPLALQELPPRNLVFLLDVSGSMDEPDKLPLLQEAMQQLVDTLRPEDSVGIVVYAGKAGVVLPPTSGVQQARIRRAIRTLRAGGSTNGGQGIRRAYALAGQAFDPTGINRVLLGTDGDFNVGIADRDALMALIEEERDSGISLSVLGFGSGNLQDSQLEALAVAGEGNYNYIDSSREAQRVLVKEGGGTLFTVARDVKVQVEFNPATVAYWRLVGYENRALAAEDFADDSKDAAEMGAGHHVTALYEIQPLSASLPVAALESIGIATPGPGDELLAVGVRWKAPDAVHSDVRRFSVTAPAGFEPGSDDGRFASAVAAWGMALRGSPYRGEQSIEEIAAQAAAAAGDDPRRRSFLELVELSRQLGLQ